MARSQTVERAHIRSFSRRILSATALTAAGMALFASPVLADNWTDHTATTGSISIDTSVPDTTNITQHTNFVKVQGNGDIDAGWTVNVRQPGSSSKYVLYDTKDDPTRILGTLNANGEVYIFDRNGVIFGTDSRVDVGSLIVSTGSVSDADLLNNDGRLTFTDIGNGKIELNGSVTVAEAGLAAFVSPFVSNNGVINAKMGKVAIGAGEKVTLDLYGDNLIEIAVTDGLSDALVENAGAINAQGGVVAIRAEAAKAAVDNVINMAGVINASSASVTGGKIVLGGGSAGTVKVSGKLDASGTQGGDIAVTGENVVLAEGSEVVNAGDRGTTYVYGTEKADFKGTLKTGAHADAEISGKTLSLGGTLALGEGSAIRFDPVDLVVGDAEAATFVSGMNTNGAVVYVEAQNSITVNAEINSSAQATNSTLHFRDEDANNDLTVNLNNKIVLGANQRLVGEATAVNVAAPGLIQNAVDIASTTVSALISVGAGTFREQVVIDKNLTLRGSERDLTIIQSPANLAQTHVSPNVARNYGVIFVHDTDNVVVSDLTVDGSTNAQTTPFNDNRRFIGIVYQNAGGTIENTRITNIKSGAGSARSGFGILAFDANSKDGVSSLNILNNTVDNFQKYGIALADPYLEATLKGNTITGDQDTVAAEQAGVYVTAMAKAEIGGAGPGEGNTISNADNGIWLFGTNGIEIVGNEISNAASHGVRASTNANRSILLAGNTLLNNKVGAEFESGVIDMTGAANRIVGDETGLIFDPKTAPAVPAAAAMAMAVVVNPPPPLGTLVLVNDTIGSTIFEDLTDLSDNFIVLANGAFFAPGNPTNLDGRFARYNGVSASDNPPSFGLSQADLDAIEEKIWHYRDDNTLGLFNFGGLASVSPPAPGSPASINQENIFRQFSPDSLQTSGLNMTITGFPPVEVQTAGAGIPSSPQGLNALSPFAGNSPGDLNEVEPAAGTDEQSTAAALNRTQPAAGEPLQYTCWGDAAGQATQGHSVNVTYGTSLEEAVDSVSACESDT